MRYVPESEQQEGVFTRAQALAAGWTRGSLTSQIESGHLLRLRRGIYLDCSLMPDPDSDTVVQRLRILSAAAVLGAPGSVASHCSGAALAGLPLLEPTEVPYLTIESGRHGTLHGVHLHRARISLPGHLAKGVERIGRTSAARTALDLARECGLEAGIVAADAALRQRRTTPVDLMQVARDCAQWPMARNAVRVAQSATRLAESPLESISRLVIAMGGLDVPELQVDVLDDRGHWLARVDFLWRERGVVGEADGLQKYTEPDALREEKRRQERLEAAGLIVVRWGWNEARSGKLLLRRIERAFFQANVRSARERRWRTSRPSLA